MEHIPLVNRSPMAVYICLYMYMENFIAVRTKILKSTNSDFMLRDAIFSKSKVLSNVLEKVKRALHVSYSQLLKTQLYNFSFSQIL